jgi:16S rRNA (guanine966-N2)-methyltransferase
MNLKKKKPNTIGQASHQVRIIGGEWKRTPLTVIAAEGLRPTPDRVRETVFNWINHLISGRWQELHCLDLFAGSGALGFEAASRGAAKVLMIEAFTPAYRQLEQTKDKLRAEMVQLQRADAVVIVEGLIQRQERFGLIFLDPPFEKGFLQKIMPVCEHLLTENGLLYVEAEHAIPMLAGTHVSGEVPVWCKGWELVRSDKAGSVFFQVLRRSKEVFNSAAI